LRFFEKFRLALGKYAEGVHELGAPAPEAAIAAAEGRLGRKLPPAWRDFLAQWNGGYLFGDDYALLGVSGARPGEARVEAGELAVGETPTGALRLDEQGRVVAIDAETEARAIEGSDFERWLDATMAREGLIFDREGEFRDGALDGVDLSAKMMLKRAEAAARADPGSPAWQEELGRLLEEAGQAGRAERAYAKAVELDPGAGAAWFAIGTLRRGS
jgi:SMI1 / KNR4 family (SUKH-1)